VDAKPRVVILGGGAGGVTAAFYLSQGDWRTRFESITIYQSGWRLGGKAASGRGEHGRIEEHGLHVWFGAYDNAFRMMRECLLELAAPSDSAVASVERAFSPCDTFVLTEATSSGWIPWIARFPRNPGMPGDGEPDGATALPEYYRRALALLLEYVRSARRRDDRPAGNESIAPLASALELLDAVLADDRPLDRSMRTLAPALRALASVARDLLKRRIGVAARRLCYLVDITAAFIKGTLEEGILSGADAWDRGLDSHDFSDWLIANGATPEAARCALVRTLCYDLPFAYRFGDPHRPTCSAATAVRGLLRVLLDYKGAIAYKPNAGMGDIMFAPLYQVLERRGVRFEFFHRVTGLRLDETETRVGEIDIVRQVSLRDPDRAYDPLVTVGGLACWPSEPILEQIAPADRAAARQPEHPDGTAVSLRDGEDFDVAVLAIPVAAHPVICEELIAARREWAEMSRRL
jgi:uncharacterized protein with NAD-binding domain and iron-sulfur cluster